MTELTLSVRNAVFKLYNDNKRPLTLLKDLAKPCEDMEKLMYELKKIYDHIDSEIMLTEKYVELAESLLLVKPSEFLQSHSCIQSNFHNLMDEVEIDAYLLLFKFQKKVRDTMSNKDLYEYIDTLLTIDYVLSTIHPYKHSSEFNNLIINKHILTLEYDYKLKHWLENLTALNEKLNFTFNTDINDKHKIKLDRSFKEEEINIRNNKLRSFIPEHKLIIKTVGEIISMNEINGHKFVYVPDIALLFMDWYNKDFD